MKFYHLQILFSAHKTSENGKWKFGGKFNHRQRRSLNAEVTIQLFVVVDKEMISFHGNHSVEEYVLTVMNMVNIPCDNAGRYTIRLFEDSWADSLARKIRNALEKIGEEKLEAMLGYHAKLP